MLRPIVFWPAPVLRRPARPVEKFDEDLRRLVRDMLDTMYDAPGVGLAANQIGIPLRVAVIDVRPEGRRQPLVLINPKIVQRSGVISESEGCLSLPGVSRPLKRAKTVRVEALDLRGLPISIKGEGLLARALQHETDHLDGKLYFHRLNWLARRRLLQEWAHRR